MALRSESTGMTQLSAIAGLPSYWADASKPHQLGWDACLIDVEVNRENLAERATRIEMAFNTDETVHLSGRHCQLETSYNENKTPAKHRDIFLPFRLHHLSHSYFGRGIGSK